MKIYLSPSDQIRNRYAYGDTNEAAQCRAIAKKCARALMRCGFEVKTDYTDGSDAMYERVQQSNEWGADMHICIHTNAGGGSGCVVFAGALDERHMKYAKPIFEELDDITIYRSVYGVRTAAFYEIRKTNAVCVYCECEFHDNAQTAKWITENTRTIAEAICRGVCRAAGREYIKEDDDDMERWNTLSEMPEVYRAMAKRFIDAGALRGKDGRLDLSEDMIRCMEIMRRYFEEGKGNGSSR